MKALFNSRVFNIFFKHHFVIKYETTMIPIVKGLDISFPTFMELDEIDQSLKDKLDFYQEDLENWITRKNGIEALKGKIILSILKILNLERR